MTQHHHIDPTQLYAAGRLMASCLEADVVCRCVVARVTGEHGDTCSDACKDARHAIDQWMGAVMLAKGPRLLEGGEG